MPKVDTRTRVETRTGYLFRSTNTEGNNLYLNITFESNTFSYLFQNCRVLFSYTQRKKRAVFYSSVNMAVNFTSRVKFMNETTQLEPNVSKSLYI